MANKIQYQISAEDKTQKAFNSVKKQVDGLSGAFSKLKTVAGVAFAGISVAGFTSMVKGAIDAGDKIQKLSVRLGASTEALSQLKHAAELSGVSFETMVMGMQRMTRRVAEAANGSGDAVNALNELGLSAAKLKLEAPEKQFEVIAEKLSQIKDPADRVRLAMKLFDSEGVALLQMMEQGANGINMMRQEADALGLTLSQKMANDMVAANDAMTRMGASTNALANTMAVQLAPYVEALANWFRSVLPGAIEVSADAFGALRHFMLEGVQKLFEGLGLLAEKAAVIASIFNDDIAQSLRSTSSMYTQMAENVEDLQFSYAKSAEPIKKFSVAHKEALPNLKAFEGATISASEALKRQREAAKEATEQVDTMSRAMDLIDAQFEKLEQDEARKFAGLDASNEAAKELSKEAKVIEGSFKDAFKSIVNDGEINFSNLANSITNKFLDIAVDDIFNNMFANVASNAATSGGGGFLGAIGGFLGDIFASAKGNVFSNGSIVPFATGGVINSPTFFPLNNGVGLAGEAGAEVIAPLKRDKQGNMGISATAANVQVNVHNNSGSSATATQRTDNGVSIIDIVIGEVSNAIGNDIARGNGVVSSAIEGTYGLNRAISSYG